MNLSPEDEGITKNIAGEYLGKVTVLQSHREKLWMKLGVYFDNVPNAPVNNSSIP